jgi:hypothetical protein
MEPLPIDRLETPCLLVDEARMTRNIDRLKTRLDRLGPTLRPHLKTCKSVDIARRLRCRCSCCAACTRCRRCRTTGRARCTRSGPASAAESRWWCAATGPEACRRRRRILALIGARNHVRQHGE